MRTRAIRFPLGITTMSQVIQNSLVKPLWTGTGPMGVCGLKPQVRQHVPRPGVGIPRMAVDPGERV